MSKDEFIALAAFMIDTYGVYSYLDNDEDDLWFSCPECGEPILFEDYGDSLALAQGICPICEMSFDGMVDYAEIDDEE